MGKLCLAFCEGIYYARKCPKIQNQWVLTNHCFYPNTTDFLASDLCEQYFGCEDMSTKREVVSWLWLQHVHWSVFLGEFGWKARPLCKAHSLCKNIFHPGSIQKSWLHTDDPKNITNSEGNIQQSFGGFPLPWLGSRFLSSEPFLWT